MNLENFIADTCSGIYNGIGAANKKTVSGLFQIQNNGQRPDISDVKFDIALTVGDQGSLEIAGQTNLGIAKGSGEGAYVHKNETVSRVSFTIKMMNCSGSK